MSLYNDKFIKYLENKSMIFEDIFKEIGDFGRGQIIQYFLLCLPSLFGGFLSVDVVFLMAVPDFVCKPDNVTMEGLRQILNTTSVDQITEHLVNLQKSSSNYKDTKCYSWNNDLLLFNLSTVNNMTKNVKCNNGFLYSKRDYGSTVPNEYDLVCDWDYVRLNLKTIFFLGCIFGAIISGQLSDMVGRLFTFLVVVLINVISGLGLFFSKSVIVISVFFFTQGFAYLGYSLTTFTLGNELVGPSKRKWTGTLFNIFYTAGFILVPIAYYYILNWRYLALISGLPSSLFLTYYFYVYESPRWLLAKGQTKKVLYIFKKISKINKVILSEKMKFNVLNHNQSVEIMKKFQRNYSIMDLIKTKQMLILSLKIWYIWIINSLIYFGLVYNTENLTGSLYVNLMLMGIIEIPAYCINIIFLDKLGRKSLLIYSSWTTGLACLIAACIFKEYSTIICIVQIIGKFSVTISFGILFVYTAELFPTVIRNSAIGMSAMVARVGTTLVVPILNLQDILPSLPMIIFGTFALSGGFMTFLLPETKNRPLDQMNPKQIIAQNNNNKKNAIESPETVKG